MLSAARLIDYIIIGISEAIIEDTADSDEDEIKKIEKSFFADIDNHIFMRNENSIIQHLHILLMMSIW